MKTVLKKIKAFFKSKYNIFVFAFCCLLVLPSILYPMMKSAVDVDLNENRNMTKLEPDLDRFGGSFEGYYNDRIPFRSLLVSLYSRFNNKFTQGITKGIINSVVPEEQAPLVIQNGVLFGKDGWLFYALADSLDYYAGANLLSDTEMLKYVKTLTSLDKLLSAMGKKLVVQICPNREQIYSEFMPKSIKVETEYKRVDRLVDYIRQNSGVTVSYSKKELLSAKADFQTHYKTDTHHNDAGAFVTYSTLLKNLNMPYNTINEVPTAIDKFTGYKDLSWRLQEPYDDTNYLVDYKPAVVPSITYTGASDHTRGVISTGGDGNKKIMLLGDSFREAQTKFIVKDFSKAYIYHYNFLPADIEFLPNIIDTDIVVLEVVERYDPMLWVLPNMLISLLTT